jgi:hypothetical protein
VLVQRVDPQPDADRGGHDLAQRVRVLDRRRRRDVGVTVGVGARLVEAPRPVERVREVERERVGGLEHQEQRVQLHEREPPARPQRAVRAREPRVDIRDPAEHADRRVDDVEAPVQRRRERRSIGLDELERHPAAVREVTRRGQRLGREVDAGHARSTARERDRVERDVRLQVQQVEAREIAHGRGFVLLERVGAGDQRLGVVVGVLAVHLRQRIPVRAVGGQIVHFRNTLRSTQWKACATSC